MKENTVKEKEGEREGGWGAGKSINSAGVVRACWALSIGWHGKGGQPSMASSFDFTRLRSFWGR